jgi:hypothetical protein
VNFFIGVTDYEWFQLHAAKQNVEEHRSPDRGHWPHSRRIREREGILPTSRQADPSAVGATVLNCRLAGLFVERGG